MLPAVELVLTSELGVVGACVSGQGLVLACTALFDERLPAASKASTARL